MRLNYLVWILIMVAFVIIAGGGCDDTSDRLNTESGTGGLGGNKGGDDSLVATWYSTDGYWEDWMKLESAGNIVEWNTEVSQNEGREGQWSAENNYLIVARTFEDPESGQAGNGTLEGSYTVVGDKLFWSAGGGFLHRLSGEGSEGTWSGESKESEHWETSDRGWEGSVNELTITGDTFVYTSIYKGALGTDEKEVSSKKKGEVLISDDQMASLLITEEDGEILDVVDQKEVSACIIEGGKVVLWQSYSPDCDDSKITERVWVKE
jgi:hypothetical protein